ncbi:MAG: DUF4390 domain-containing protein [Candidatus Sedimenticola sp. PURPLELP]
MSRGDRRHISFNGLIWMVLVLLFPATASAEAGFEVARLNAELVDGQYLLDADIDYRFSEEASEALMNGVPLILEAHLQIRRKGAWIWENDIQDVRLRYQLRYQALAEIYQVNDLQSGDKLSFVTRQAALNALGKIRQFPIIEHSRLTPGEEYEVALKTTLDIEALPLPLRPMAYLTPAWKLASEWKIWLLVP